MRVVSGTTCARLKCLFGGVVADDDGRSLFSDLAAD
jgi:hypothetical protein